MSVLGIATGKQRPRKRNDFYPTIDPRAVAALAPHLVPGTIYAEPCAGEGDLIALLASQGLVCDWALEMEPTGGNRWPIGRGNALNLTAADLGAASCFVTNPPWSRALLHALIRHLAGLLPTWLLFDASWKHTKQAAALAPYCTDIVSVGRLKWFAGSKYDPPDDCAWYCFDARPAIVSGRDQGGATRFHFRHTQGAPAAQMMLI